MSTLSASLAEGVQALWESRLTPEAISTARLCVEDLLGVALAASRDPAADSLKQLRHPGVQEGQCSLIGSPDRAQPSLAAFWNGTLGHLLDYDDCAYPMVGHPSAVIVPACLAVCECEGLSGSHLLRAYIVGFEVSNRVGRAVNPELYERGWHATGAVGVLGACAAASVLLGLTKQEIRHSLGIAASFASGLRANFGSVAKSLHAGRAAEGGVTAAYLARGGATSSDNALEGELGYARVLAGVKLDPEDVCLLDEPLAIVDPGVFFKKYPSCGSTHTCIDAISSLVSDGRIRPEQIERIDVYVHPSKLSILPYSEPRSGLEAKFSMEFCAAAAALGCSMTCSDFSTNVVTAASVRRMMARVCVHPDGGIEKQGFDTQTVRVELGLDDGSRVRRVVTIPPGQRPRELSRAEHLAKFASCAAVALSPSEVGHLAEMTSALDEVADVRSLGNLLHGAEGRQACSD